MSPGTEIWLTRRSRLGCRSPRRRRATDRTRPGLATVAGALAVLPFNDRAAEAYGSLRARLESAGEPLAEPDLRIASIALARELGLSASLAAGTDRRAAVAATLDRSDFLAVRPLYGKALELLPE